MASDVPPYVLQLRVPLDVFHSAGVHLKECAGVGNSDAGVGVVAALGNGVGAVVGDSVGLVVGVMDGALLGPSVGLRVGTLLGLAVGGAAAQTRTPEPCREVQLQPPAGMP